MNLYLPEGRVIKKLQTCWNHQHSCNELSSKGGGDSGKVCGAEEVMRVSLQTVNCTGIWASPCHSHMATFLGSLSPMEESPCFSARVITFTCWTHFLALPVLCLPELPATPQICCIFSYLHASAYAVPFRPQSSFLTLSLWGHWQLQFHSYLSIIGHSTILYGQLDSCC